MVLPYEVKYLAVLAKHMDVPEPLFERLPTGFYAWVITGYCPFYDAANRACRIHHEKPLACKMFPLLVNPSTLELSVSSACEWIKKNLSELTNLGEKVEEVFSSEFNAVKELVTALYRIGEKGLISLILLGDEIEGLFEGLANRCTIIKFLKSSIVRGLYLVLLSDCSKDSVEDLLRDLGKFNIPYVDGVLIATKPAEHR